MATSAQDSACADLVDRALAALGEHCGDLERNSACIGNGQVDATYSSDFSADFSQPGDRAPAALLLHLTSSGLSLEDGQFGVAAIRLGAHLPATHSGPGPLLMLVGDATLRHDAELARIHEIGEPISTATMSSATLYAQPSKIAAVIGELDQNTIALVDAISSDGDWLRVIIDGNVAWAESAKLARLRAMDALPAIDIGDPFAWRHFSFASASELPDCAAAESMLVVQTPADLSANLRINGADIHINSLVSFQQPHSKALGMTVHRGSAANTAGETISTGHTIIGVLDDRGQVLAWSGALPASDEELARGERAQIALNGLARSNGWDEFDTEMEAGAVIHTVVSGDTLYALARFYDVPVADIIAANSQTSALRLLVGEELVIPSPGSGYLPVAAAAPSASPQPTQPSEPDCSGLRLTSPQSAATGSASPYYWDGIPAATGYRVDVWDHGSGAHLATMYTHAGQTTVTISAGELRVGGAMQWEVTALIDGQPICSTGRSNPLVHVSS